ncbi:DUF4144 family protein [Vibrio maritimus]|jgi:hypothetical protein|uniref:DUF4144 family protein n=1 Tax=Vibrio chaetopteri TaxID=3016528 RepID=A0AAU8BDL9_9VIBR
MIQWPCLFKLEGDDELLFLALEADLVNELESLIASDEDILIDSSGEVFKVELDSSHNISFKAQYKTLTLEEVTSLVQAHEFALAQVCVIKIGFNSIKEAVQAMRTTH